MSDTRETPAPDTSQQFTFQQPLPDTQVASTWRPKNGEGLAQIEVPALRQPLLLTLNAAGERIQFPTGIYTVPKFLVSTGMVYNAVTKAMEQVENKMAIAGEYDEAKSDTDGEAMHPHLRRSGVKRSGQQPVEERPQPARHEAAERHDQSAPLGRSTRR